MAPLTSSYWGHQPCSSYSPKLYHQFFKVSSWWIRKRLIRRPAGHGGHLQVWIFDTRLGSQTVVFIFSVIYHISFKRKLNLLFKNPIISKWSNWPKSVRIGPTLSKIKISKTNKIMKKNICFSYNLQVNVKNFHLIGKV